MINLFIGLLIAILPIILFYTYVFIVLKKSNVIYMLQELKASEWIIIVFIFFCSVSVSSILLQKNHYIYIWDYCMHWAPAINLTNTVFTTPKEALKYLANTIAYDDYNATEPLLYVIFIKIFGKEYSTVVKIVHIFYMCPAYICISLCINKFISLFGYGKKSITLYVGFAAVIPIIHNVILKGYLDSPVLIISTCIIMFISDIEYKSYNLKNNLIIAIGIMMLIVFRRHFAYWTIGLIFVLFTLFIFQFFNVEKGRKLVLFRNFCLSMLTIGGFCILCLVFPLRHFLIHSLRNYTGMYVAWNGSIAEKFGVLKQSFGSLIIITAIVLPFSIIVSRKNIKYIISLLLLIMIPFIIMSRSVIMHDAHFYIIVVPILILFSLGVNAIVDLITIGIIKKIVVFLFITYSFITYLVYSFFWYFEGINNKLFTYLFKQNSHYQVLYRSDVESIKQLVKTINQLAEENNTDIYIAAASNELNRSLLAWADQPESFWSVPRMANSSQVDLRDGFYTTFFDCGIVVVQEPTPDLENNHYQKSCYGTSWFISELLRDNSSQLGKHFQFVQQFNLDNGQKADVYRKITSLDYSDYIFMMDFYDKLYPEHKELFSDRIKEYMSEHNIKE